MKTISIDIETFASVELAKSGVYRYAESPDFEILLFGYSVDGGEVKVVDFTAGETLPPEILDALTDDSVRKWAFNASFERVCLSRYLRDMGVPLDPFADNHPSSATLGKAKYLNPESWRCSMVWAAYMGLPLSLEGAGAVLGLEKQKLTEGKELVRFFCKPCAATAANGQRLRNLPERAPDKWTAFQAYNRHDVETEMAIQARLAGFPVPDAVWEEYVLDQEINDRGVALDRALARNAITADARSREELTRLMREITELDNPNSVAQMKEWLAGHGLETDSLGKKAVAELLRTAPEPLRGALSLRQQLAKSSVKKYQVMENAVCADGRVRGLFQFYGANRTGRWSGRLLQPQNLPQNHLPDLEHARALVRAGDFEALELLYDSVPEVLSELIRTAFVPRPGRKFIVADFSAIEARVISWLAGEQWKMDAFAACEDIYCATASQMFHLPVVKHGENGHLRQKGKIAELACIAEGQLVLTDKGLIPIEEVTRAHLLWDGESWIRHGGVIYKGRRRVIEYEGLIATPDHLVWVEGKPRAVRFEDAAAGGAHLVQSGDGRRAIWVGANHQPGKAVESGDEPLLCPHPVSGLRQRSMAGSWQSDTWKIEGMSAMFTAAQDTSVAGQATHGGKTTLRESKRRRISRLRRARNSLRFSERDFSRDLFDPQIRLSGPGTGDRPNRQQRELRTGQSSFRQSIAELRKQAQYRFIGVALPPGAQLADRIVVRDTGCAKPVYDIRNCGPRHRFVVWNNGKGRIVSNCVQAISRDILAFAMRAQRHCSIVMHVHDEMVIEADNRMSVEVLCEQMSRTPPWAEGLLLRAEGYDCPFYKKD